MHFQKVTNLLLYRSPDAKSAMVKSGKLKSNKEPFSAFRSKLNTRKDINSDNFVAENYLKLDLLPKSRMQGTCRCQMVRSASRWSLGLRETTHESSIQIAYLNLIREAKHFIYIENQFFISKSGGEQVVHNAISEALIERIKRAALKKEKFRVMVFIPLLPGFEGEIYNSNSSVLKIQMFWEYATICRGGTSILETLARDPNISDPSEYIGFFSLRQHDKLGDLPISELVYIHSKVKRSFYLLLNIYEYSL